MSKNFISFINEKIVKIIPHKQNVKQILKHLKKGTICNQKGTMIIGMWHLPEVQDHGLNRLQKTIPLRWKTARIRAIPECREKSRGLDVLQSLWDTTPYKNLSA
jgi:hypothetical protein